MLLASTTRYGGGEKSTNDFLVDISDVPSVTVSIQGLTNFLTVPLKNLLLDLLDVRALEAVIAGLIGGSRGGGNAGSRGFGSLKSLGGLLLGRLGLRLTSLSSHGGRVVYFGGGEFARGVEALSAVTCDRLGEGKVFKELSDEES